MRFIQPRPAWAKRAVPRNRSLQLPFRVWHVLHRYAHHAGPSGYDRLCDFVGEEIEVGRALYYAGETLLRPLALLDARFGGQYEYSRYDWVLERALMRQMRKSRKALFHVLYGEKNYKHAWRVADVNGNKLIATLHYPPEHYDRIFRSKRHLQFLSHAIVMGEELKLFAETMVGSGRVTVVPYGVDVDYFTPLNSRERTGPPVILFAGFHLRDYDTLARVVDIVLRGHSSAEFVLISNDPRCEALGRQHPQRVRRLERLSDQEYRRVLQNSDLMTLPLEGSVAVTAALEAMACGVPILTTEGGIRDYVLPDAGLVFPRRDAEGMGHAALQILRDEALLSNLKARTRLQALRFAWPLIAERTAEVYRRVMSC